MRKLLNTLYVLTPNAHLQKDGENVVVKVEQQETFRIPIHNLEGIICFSYMGASPGVMQLCCNAGVKLSILSPSGRYIASIEGPVKGNVLLRRSQYRIADDDATSAHFSALFIAAKIANQRSVLSRFIRDHHPEGMVLEELEAAKESLKQQQRA